MRLIVVAWTRSLGLMWRTHTHSERLLWPLCDPRYSWLWIQRFITSYPATLLHCDLFLQWFLLIYMQGHGYMLTPPGRASIWRKGFPTDTINYGDNGLFCGGFSVSFRRRTIISKILDLKLKLKNIHGLILIWRLDLLSSWLAGVVGGIEIMRVTHFPSGPSV